MGFEPACALTDIPADEALAVTIGGYEVAIAVDGDEVFAVQNECSHAAVALSEGEVSSRGSGPTIECWLHGSCFDLRTGKPTHLPATEPVATFPVEIRHVDDSATVWVDTETTLNGVTPT